MRTDLDAEGKLFLHRNGKLITCTRMHMLYAKVQTIDYQEIEPHTTAIIKTKLDSTPIDDQNNYMLTADSAFIENNPNLNAIQP